MPTAPGANGAYLSWTDATGTLQWMTFDVVLSEEWGEPATVTEHPVEVGADVADHVRVGLVKCTLRVQTTNEPIGSNDYDDPELLPLALTPPVAAPLPALPIGTLQVPQWQNNILIRDLALTLVGLGASSALGAGGGGTATVLSSIAIGNLIPGVEVILPVPVEAGLPPTPLPMFNSATDQRPSAIDYVAATHSTLKTLKDAATIFTVFGTKSVCFSMVIEELTFHREFGTGSGEEISIGLKQIRVVQTRTVAQPIPYLSGGGGTPPVNKGAQDPPPAPTQQQVQSLLAMGLGFIFGSGAPAP
jgi:hypothetical protein